MVAPGIRNPRNQSIWLAIGFRVDLSQCHNYISNALSSYFIIISGRFIKKINKKVHHYSVLSAIMLRHCAIVTCFTVVSHVIELK